MKKLAWLALPLLVLAAGTIYWLTHRPSDPAVTSRDETAAVERRTLEYVVKSSGEIAPAVQVDVKPEISARIKSVQVLPGQVVKKGDLLVELDDRDLQTEREAQEIRIRGAQVQLDQARRQLDRSRALQEKGLIPRQDLEQAQTMLDLAQNNLDKAQGSLRGVLDRLAKTQVFAPISGTVLVVPVVAGQVVVGAASVNSGTLLLTLADLSQMLIYTQINQVDITQLKLQQEADFTVDSVRNRSFKGTISLISPVATVKNNNKGFQVTVLIQDLDSAIRPGMTANLSFPIKRVERALSLPLPSVFTAPDGSRTAYVWNPTGEAEERRIEVGLVTFDYAEVISGLNEGERVLLVKPSTH